MNADQTVAEIVSRAIEQLTGTRPAELTLTLRPLQGGLTAAAVTHVHATYGAEPGKRRTQQLVLKQLQGEAIREQRIYQDVVAGHATHLSPKLIAVVAISSGCRALVLESVRGLAWPWRETGAAQLVVERLASFHASTRGAVNSKALAGWDYEQMLQRSAADTYESLLRCRSHPELAVLRRAAPPVKRIVLDVSRWRKALLRCEPFGPCVVHGDVHPGNVMLRARHKRGQPEPVLIDWERARSGSALEDVSSWLQSLGFWEPEARRRHDTILASYLSARGLERRLTSEIRAAYWIAGASNALAGALRYHLTVASKSANDHERAAAARAAFAWLRVLRRADAFWS